MENSYIVCYDDDEIGQFSSEVEAEDFMTELAQSLLDGGIYNSDSVISYYSALDHTDVLWSFTMAEAEQGCLF